MLAYPFHGGIPVFVFFDHLQNLALSHDKPLSMQMLFNIESMHATLL